MIKLKLVMCLFGIVGCIVFLLAYVALIVLVLNNKRLPKRFCNNFPYWHLAPEKVGFDGCSMNGTCPRCGKHVLCDSNGDWF